TEHSISLNFAKSANVGDAFATGVVAGPLPAAQHFFAVAGDPLCVRYGAAIGWQPAVFSFDAHCWPFEPLLSGSQGAVRAVHAAERNRRRTRHRPACPLTRGGGVVDWKLALP